MITLKSAHEIELMRRAGKITAAARALAGEMVKPGVTTQEIDRAVEHFIRKQGAVPSFLHFPGPPGAPPTVPVPGLFCLLAPRCRRNPPAVYIPYIPQMLTTKL